jgi:GntR family transcriptional repressor for pyruvate dehydrogenase complex
MYDDKTTGLGVKEWGVRVTESKAPSESPHLNLVPAARARLTESVAQQLLAAIGDLEPGTRVPTERELTKSLRVSRTTLREALRGLAVLGVIEIHHGQGMFVASHPSVGGYGELNAALSKGVTRDMIEARRIIVVEVARLAAVRRTDEDIGGLAAAVDAHRRAVRAGRAPVREGLQFDIALGEASHNEVLTGVIRSFHRLMAPRNKILYERVVDFGERDLEAHIGIFEAIRDGNADEAAIRMADHVTQAHEVYQEAGEA